MGKSKQESTQTTTQTLPGSQQRNVDVLMREALNYFQGGGRSFFPGDTVADFDPLQLQGQEQLLNYASGIGGDLVSNAIAGNQFFMDPNNIMNPDSIPGFTGVIDSMRRNSNQNLTENVLPYVRGQGTSSGQFGGSATGIGQALTVDRSQEALNDAIASMYLGAYGQGLDTFNQSLNRAPGLFALGAQPGSIVTNIGDVRQNQAQAEIGGERERFEFEQNEPAVILSLLQALTGTAGQYGLTEETTRTDTTSGGELTQALGALMAIGGLMSGNPQAAMGGVGMMGGGGAGGGGGYSPLYGIGPPPSPAGNQVPWWFRQGSTPGGG